MSDDRRQEATWADLGAAWQAEVGDADRVANVDVAALRARARKHARMIRFRNARELVACVVVAGTGANFIRVEGPLLMKLTGVVWIACGAWIAFVLWRRGGNAPPPPPTAAPQQVLAALRSEMERQAALLDDVWRWYLLPCLPPILMLWVATLTGSRAQPTPGAPSAVLVATAVSVAMALIVGLSFWFVHWLNRRAARKLRQDAARLLEAAPDAVGGAEAGVDAPPRDRAAPPGTRQSG